MTLFIPYFKCQKLSMTASKPMLSQKSTLECRECGCEIGEMSVMFPRTVGDLKPQLELDPSHAALP